MSLMLAAKATLILLAAFSVALALWRASAAVRHVIWTCTFACLLVLPLLQWSGMKWRVAVPPAAVEVLSDAPIAESTTATHDAPPSRTSGFNWLWVWYTGVALTALRLLSALLRLHQLQAGARPAAWAAEVAARTRIRESAGINLPIAFGLLRPTILFPPSAADWPAERRRLVLEHELAHVQRCDCLTQLLAEIACVIYWFNPLVWLAASQFRKERERACDDAVLNVGTKSSDYAEHLLSVVRSQNKGASLPMAISINSHNLQARLEAVLKPDVNRRAATPALVAAIATITLLLSVSIATIRAQTQEPAGNAAAGGVIGSVHDPSGAAVPHAIITATGLDTHNKEVTNGGADGTYVFRGLPAGRYVIEVQVSGFSTFQKEIVVGGQPIQLYPTMEIGRVLENVDVIGQRPASSASATPRQVPQRIRVGGMVQAVKLVYRTEPVYPEHAKQNGIQGVVVLQGVIGTNGSLLSIAPLSKSVDPELVQAARDSVSQWRYEPVLLNGEPVEAVTTITVNFRLD